MFLTPIVLTHNLQWAIPMTLMLGVAPVYLPVWCVWRVATAVLPKKCYNVGDCFMYSSYQRMLMFFVLHYARVKVYLYGDVDKIQHKENVIYLSNHQSTVDWFVADILAIQQGSLGDLRYILKDGLKYLPMYGFYFRQHGGVYISRGHKFKSDKAAKHLHYFCNNNIPVYWELSDISRCLECDNLPRGGVWLVIFPEGTRYNPQNQKSIEESQHVAQQKGLAVLDQVLTPRVKATQVCVDNLRGHVTAVYDVTVGYGDTFDGKRLVAPSILDLFSRKHTEIHIHVKRIEVDAVPEGDEMRQWLHHRFVEKDRLLQDFYTTSRFPGTCHDRPIKMWTTLLPTVIFSSAFIATITCSQGRSFYRKSFVLSTLGAWLWAAAS